MRFLAMTSKYRQYGIACKLFLLVFSILLLVQPVLADDDGRYRAVVLHEGGQSGQPGSLTPKVFVIDSRDGHMWILEQNTKLHDPEGGFAIGSVLTYQGQVKPGKKMGEIVEQGARW